MLIISRPQPHGDATIILELWHNSLSPGSVRNRILASASLTASQLVAKENTASEVQVDFTLHGEPALRRESDIVITLALFPASRPDVEKGQTELDGAKLAAQKMDDMNKGGALRRLSTVTEKIIKLQGMLDEASQVRDGIFCSTL